MADKGFDWLNGAQLLEHTRCELRILEDYLVQYLAIRCQLPAQQKFRLAVIDGFAGGGRYNCGTAGSPILFIEGFERALQKINIDRRSRGLGVVEMECLLVFNDINRDVIELLKTNCAPVLADVRSNTSQLHFHAVYLSEAFEAAYPKIKELITNGRYRNILFNLDQCGTIHVEVDTITDIMTLSSSVEIFYTFMVGSHLAFLSKTNPDRLNAQLAKLNIAHSDLERLRGGQNNDVWMGKAERVVFENFYRCARFVSPFSINNPDGWRYWLMHFANSYRARQAYNDVLHENASMQVHFGRSGLNMLSYDPRDEGQAYLFDVSGRKIARNQLMSDIPRVVSDHGDAISIESFYESIYNTTPAHGEDIHVGITKNPDLEVLTSRGGKRRKPHTIKPGDTLRLKRQKSFFPMFFSKESPENDEP